jgi:hypothetical protein
MRSRTGERSASAPAAIALLFVSLFCGLFPDALPSTTSHAFNLTLVAASSSHYTLTVMTVVAIVFVPIVLAYTAWTYWVFRFRIGASDFAGTGRRRRSRCSRTSSAAGRDPEDTPEGSAASRRGLTADAHRPPAAARDPRGPHAAAAGRRLGLATAATSSPRRRCSRA